MNGRVVQQYSEVEKQEHEAIRLRREQRRQPAMGLPHTLVGLALSGGGIRSATFGLGVLEELRRRNLLDKVDYLSTVSGGGYIGAWLSANCRQAARRQQALRGDAPLPPQIETDPQAFSAYCHAAHDWLDPGTNWGPSIAHLRRYSNYLSPRLGLFSADAWSMLAIWLRNTMLVQLTVILGLAALLLAPRLLFELFMAWPRMPSGRWISVALFVLGVSGIAANLRLVRGDQGAAPAAFASPPAPASWRQAVLLGGGGLLAAWLACAALDFQPFSDTAQNPASALLVAALLVASGYCLLPLGPRLLAPFYALAARQPDQPQRINYGQGWTQNLVVLPIMLSAILYSAVLWGLASGSHGHTALQDIDSFGAMFSQAWRYWPFPLAIVFTSLWLLSLASWRHEAQRARRRLYALLAPLPAVLVLHALFCLIMLLMHGWAADGAHGQWQAFVWGPTLVLYSFSLAIVALSGIMGRQSSEGVREWWARLGAWFLIYGFAWLGVTVAAVYGAHWTALLFNSGGWQGWSALGGWLLTTVGGLLAGKSEATGRQKRQHAPTTASAAARSAVALVGPYVFIAGLVLATATVLHLLLLHLSGAAGADCCNWVQLQAHHWDYMSFAGISPTLVLTVLDGLLIAMALLAWRVDINIFSLNTFYRGRLVRCYLGAARFVPKERNPQHFTQFDDDDDLDLAEAPGADGRAAPPAGPLHIVNCALNLGGSSDLALHTRHADNFTLTPYSIGSNYGSRRNGLCAPLGYIATGRYYADPPQAKLGQAISVSGAAASPNMGYHTSTAVACLLTLFNVRLGWWFPNPAKPEVAAPSPSFSLRYLVKELFGGANDRSNYLMISDGGHFENLAAYELVRRRCRLIIVSDAECDPELKFEGLGTLIRMCEVDFGATITLDVKPIVGDPESEWSPQRYAVGTIKYGEGHPDGVLIYLKAAMTGDEDSALLQYKACHSAFPHESTGDQFYGEDQFESYRRLGRDIAGTALEQLSGSANLIMAATRLAATRPRPGAQRAA